MFDTSRPHELLKVPALTDYIIMPFFGDGGLGDKRYYFAEEYSKANEWEGFPQLSMEQLHELRRHPRWMFNFI